MYSVLVAVLDSLLVIEALESKHIKSFLHFFHLFFNSGFLSLKKLFSEFVSSAAFLTPFHKLLDVADFKT